MWSAYRQLVCMHSTQCPYIHIYKLEVSVDSIEASHSSEGFQGDALLLKACSIHAGLIFVAIRVILALEITSSIL